MEMKKGGIVIRKERKRGSSIRMYCVHGPLLSLRQEAFISRIENADFFDYGIVSENEIIPVSNQATELPNLIHVFSCSTPGQTKILSLVQGQMAM